MAKLKEVLSSEVHWQLAGWWHIKDQANSRIRTLMGADSALFAPVYVTHGGYYWSDPDGSGWSLLSDASDADRTAIVSRIEGLKQNTISRYPTQKARIEQIFTYPNDDFVFYRRDKDGTLEVRLTGWGFANFHRAHGGVIVDLPDDDKIREVTISFNIDGIRVPSRPFTLFRGTQWVELTTDASGVYNFGKQAPGATVLVRDTPTGRQSNVVVDDNTGHIDVDVTEYLTVRVNAERDGEPVDGEIASVAYGHRTAELTLAAGTAECRLPWLEGEQCKVSFGDETQTRALVKDSVNVFNFKYKKEEEKEDPKVLFNGVLIVENNSGRRMGNYPVNVETVNGTLSYLTDSDGKILLTDLVEGTVMTASDGNRPEIRESFMLSSEQTEYLFRLPYDDVPAGPLTVRVIELNNRPAAGVTIILSQDQRRFTGTLDDKGEVHLDFEGYDYNRPVDVDLYTPRRTFPKLTLKLEPGETEYELREVKGPTPWWKILLEILLALAAAFALILNMAWWYDIYNSL